MTEHPPVANPPLPLRLLAAGGITLLALALSLAMLPLVSGNPFIFFFGAIALSAWYGGLAGGLVSTLLSLVLTNYFLIEPIGSIVLTFVDGMRLLIFAAIASLISWLSEARRAAAARAWAEADRFRVTLASIGDAVISTDAEGRVTFMNSVAEQLTGWPRAEATGRPCAEVFDIISEESGAAVESPVERVLREGVVVGLANHTLLRARDGGTRPIDDSGAPIRDVADAVVGAVLVFRDQTEQRRVEQERAELLEQRGRLQRVTAALGAALTPAQVGEIVMREVLAALDADAGTVLTFDAERRMLHIIGSHNYPADLIGQTIDRPLDQPGPLRDALVSGAIVTVESAEDVAARWPAIAHTPKLTGDIAGAAVPLLLDNQALGAFYVAFRRPHRFSPEELALLLVLGQQCAQALERARLYEAEQRARLAAEQAVQLRDVFFSVAAHELKTPLTSLLGRAQLLQRRAAREGHLDERDARAVAVIVAQAQRVSKLVSTMLDMARIEQGRLTIVAAPLDLGELVGRVVDELRPTLEQHTIALELPPGPLMIAGDPLRLEQVVQNLLDNAVKYSPAGGRVGVRLGRAGGEARLSISDEGVGIPAAAIPSLFERFYRADSTNPRQVTGLGVGLYVVHEVVSQHGGTVSVESVEGRGSTFTVCLPLVIEDTSTS